MVTINKEKIIAAAGRVVVLYGGLSSEREISLKSGAAVLQGLKRLGIDCMALDVREDVIEQLQSIRPNLVVNMLHGRGGEDGVVQGALELLGLPYTGSGVLASALAMDKCKSKQIWQQMGLRTAPFHVLNESSDWQALMRELGRAVVKPVHGGSSLGISIVEDADSLRAQYEKAQEFDLKVMAESYVEGREFSTGVLCGELLPTIELETDRQFFDYEAKYVDPNTRLTCPARLGAEELERLEQLVLQAYKGLDCSGLARVDVMQSRAGEFFLLELNTVPGMTDHSFLPIAAQKVGIEFDDLLLLMLDRELCRASTDVCE